MAKGAKRRKRFPRDRTYVSAVERGEKNPTISVLVRIARALKVKPAELVELPSKRR